MKSLSEILNLSRTNRPDEWSMDDFSRMASVLEKRILEIEEQLQNIVASGYLPKIMEQRILQNLKGGAK
jgi:hypothetical protein